MIAFRKFYIALIFSSLVISTFAQHGGTEHPQQAAETQHEQPNSAHDPAATPQEGEGHHEGCGHPDDPNAPYSAGETALHHIADANAIHIYGDLYLNLPCFLYAPGKGWTITSTGAFHAHHHANGTVAKDGYVLVHGNIMRVRDAAFPTGEVEVSEPTHEVLKVNGKEKIQYYVQSNGTCYALDQKSTLDGGLMGGGITSFYDFSITRNVFTMLVVFLILFLMLRSAAKAYKTRDGMAPKGMQSFLEPVITFIRDDVAKPNIGHHHEKYMPYLLSVFFFILGLNLIGQIPFFPGSGNVTGNLSVTLVLAVLTFLITNLTANKHYWEHTLWMPGVPTVLKVLILTPVEILGLVLKPFTLMLRLFANITAGHIVIVSFVSLIFIFGKATATADGTIGGSTIGALVSIPLTMFMMALELLVAFLQAYIFTMLSSVYFGMATEEAHH